MKKKVYYFLSFICPILIFFIVSTMRNYIPFGKYSFNVFDAYSQYPTFLVELGNILKNGTNIFYTLHGGMGVNFFSILNYYGGSPLNLFVVFFDNLSIYTFYTLLIYIKIGLSGLTMYIYLNSLKTKYKDSIWNVVFSLIYALSGYVVAFNMHIMWIDAYILLPLIIKGLDLLILENKKGIYIVFLALLILINYYMGFIVCIFLALYFVYKTLITNNFTLKIIGNFIKCSLIAVLLSAVVLIPTVINLMGGRFANLTNVELFKFDWFTMFSHFYNMSIGSFIIEDNKNFGSATIYASLFVLVLIIYFFLNKKVDKKEKIITGTFLGLFTFSFVFKLFDLAWNFFQEPIWWSHRYQFVYIFLIIVIAYQSFCRLDNIKVKKKYLNLIIIIFTLGLIASMSYKLLGLQLEYIYIIMLFLSIVLFFIYMHFIDAKYIFIVLVILELGANAFQTMKINRGVEYNKILKNNKEINEVLERIDDLDETRVITVKNFEDLGMLHSFNSIELFSSSYNMLSAEFISKVNIAQESLNHQSVNIYNPAVLSLLGVKYLIGESNYYRCEDLICVNDYALPLMFGVDIKENNGYLKGDYKKNIEDIYSALLNEDIVMFDDIGQDNYSFDNLKIDENNNFYEIKDDAQIKLEYKALKREMVIFDNIDVMNNSIFEAKVNGEKIDFYKEKWDKLIILNKNDKLEIIFNYDESYEYKFSDFYISLLDLNVYEDSIKKINSKVDVKIELDSDYVLKGRINTEYDKILINLPYDEGLIIKVDGNTVNYEKIFDTFVSIDVLNGEHLIEISYKPKGIVLGLGVSVLTFITTIFTVLLKKIKLRILNC